MFLAPLPMWVPISSPFGQRSSGMHYGIDWAAPLGETILCADTGFVRYRADEPGGYGNTLTVEHPGGWESRYAHLLEFHVGQGDNVGRGQSLGRTGGAAGAPGAGSSTGPHLHSELRQHGVAVDPYPLLTWSGGEWSEEMTDEQLATLGQWMQEQSALVLNTLVGAGWQGQKGILGAWHQDDRAVINAHTSAVVAPNKSSEAASAEAAEAAYPTDLEQLTPRDG